MYIILLVIFFSSVKLVYFKLACGLPSQEAPKNIRDQPVDR